MFKYERNEWLNKGETGAIPISPDNLNRMELGILGALHEINSVNFENLVIQRISSSCEWVAPKAHNNTFKILCGGGGGGGGYAAKIENYVSIGAGGGGGGYLTFKEVEIPAGTTVDIICGAGGAASTNGGTTYFGNDGDEYYVYAEGGERGGDSDITNKQAGKGGDGVAGGGGGSAIAVTVNLSNMTKYRDIAPGDGGKGSLFGGGGAGVAILNKQISYNTDKHYVSKIGQPGSGGKYGGDGGDFNEGAKPSRETPLSFLELLFDISTLKTYVPYVGGEKGYGSGGVFSNGGKMYSWTSGLHCGSGGGGGFFGNGGAGAAEYGAGGGGGGYRCSGGGGGSGKVGDNWDEPITNGGGGGGFFGYGAAGGAFNYGGGGGGFFCNASDSKGGDGGVLIMYVKPNPSEEEDE